MAVTTDFRRYAIADGLPVLTVDGYRADFPLHRHEVFSLTLVRRGYETTLVEDRELIAPRGSISLTAPSILHANPNRNDGSYDFTTLYLSPDFLRYLNGGKSFQASTHVTQDARLYGALSAWVAADTPTLPILEQCLRQLLQYSPDKHRQSRQDDADLREILHFFEENFARKLDLDELARRAGKSRYQFVRWF
ncbi:MAG: AraC family ligand binding domain-containing protein, partial [Bacteroidota bacterium]